MSNTFDEMVIATRGLSRALAMAGQNLDDKSTLVVELSSRHAFKELQYSIMHTMPKNLCLEYEDTGDRNQFKFRGFIFTFKDAR